MKTFIIIIAAAAVGFFSSMEVDSLFYFRKTAEITIYDFLLPSGLVLGASFGLAVIDPQRWWAVAIVMTLPALLIFSLQYPDLWFLISSAILAGAGVSSWLGYWLARDWPGNVET